MTNTLGVFLHSSCRHAIEAAPNHNTLGISLVPINTAAMCAVLKTPESIPLSSRVALPDTPAHPQADPKYLPGYSKTALQCEQFLKAFPLVAKRLGMIVQQLTHELKAVEASLRSSVVRDCSH